MATHIQLFFLGNAAFVVACKNSEHGPKVTVADSEHLLINWVNAFEGCDSSDVQNTVVEVGSSGFTTETVRVNATFDTKEAKVRTSSCLGYPEIKIRLKYNESDVWSLPSSYNNYHTYNIKIEGLYSGMLQKQLINQICVKKDGFLSIPDIPEELNSCVSFETLSKKEGGWEIRFEIVNPLSKDRTTRVREAILQKKR